ncbi:hypothetical protein ACHAWO_007911 [Cyclotella atomus]|uniref:Uncharacterized protein n=1 Tax=Cyclotella atomus TaxID=382360 RepID=A0ABD3NK60_9STRA
MNSPAASVLRKRLKRLTAACVVGGLWIITFLQQNTDLTRLLDLPFSESRPSRTTQDGPSFTVDILSVASINQLHLLNAQHKTLASHISVRNFFHVTEHDDTELNCHRNLTLEQVRKVSNFCRKRVAPESHRYFSNEYQTMKQNYARTQWLEQKKNPMGWLCAQKRPVSGLMKAFRHYQREALPSYLIIVDDDTYWNMELFEQHFKPFDSNEAHVIAGCMVRLPVHKINFTFPFGGFGIVLSNGALKNLFQNMYCGDLSDTNDPKCAQIAKNLVGERQSYEEGMSLIELIHAYVNKEYYCDVDSWDKGFCMHSDWVYGYFFNWYNISEHVKEEFYKNVPQARMDDYKGSIIYAKGTGFCRNDFNDGCKNGTEICHRAPVDWMQRELEIMKVKAPHKYTMNYNDLL